MKSNAQLPPKPTILAASKSVGGEPELSKHAFALWEQAGHPADREWEFWRQAENEFAAASRAPCHRRNFQTLRINHSYFGPYDPLRPGTVARNGA